jgi:ribonuclease HI
MEESNEVHMYFDGAARNNQKEGGGPSGCGAYITLKDKSIEKFKYLGNQTNNFAEYSGLILGLQNLLELELQGEKIKIFGDSNLVINQMKGIWKVNASNLIPLWKEAQKLSKNFKDVEFIHVVRELNKKADKLANMAINLTTNDIE